MFFMIEKYKSVSVGLTFYTYLKGSEKKTHKILWIFFFHVPSAIIKKYTCLLYKLKSHRILYCENMRSFARTMLKSHSPVLKSKPNNTQQQFHLNLCKNV